MTEVLAWDLLPRGTVGGVLLFHAKPLRQGGDNHALAVLVGDLIIDAVVIHNKHIFGDILHFGRVPAETSKRPSGEKSRLKTRPR